jgi:hypothetical protein
MTSGRQAVKRPPQAGAGLSLRAKRSNPASFAETRKLDCFVASLLAMTVTGCLTIESEA